jgi:hypothetical protein
VPRRPTEVQGYTWEEFLDLMRDEWEPGQHFSLSALTGTGKSTFMGGLLSHCRQFVLALDIKGGDEVLESLGWERLESPPTARSLDRLLEKNDRKGKPNRFVVGPVPVTEADWDRQVRALRAFILLAFEMGGWTLYIDELQVAADRRMMNLEGIIARLLVSARQPKRITIASSFQAPSWVPTEAVRQPVWFGTSATRDEAMIRRLAEVMGKDYHELVGAMRGLEDHEFLIVNRNPHTPLIVTKPEKL